MRKLVSKECLENILEDIREANADGTAVPMHPLVLRRVIEEIIMGRLKSYEST